MGRVRLDRADLHRVYRGESRRVLMQRGPQVVNRAKVLAPVDTGRLRAAIKGRLVRNWTLRSEYQITVNVDYAEAVHDGTRPHIIRPRNAQALRFNIGGRIVYAKVVHHPGTRARPFLDRALREVTGGLGYRITES